MPLQKEIPFGNRSSQYGKHMSNVYRDRLRLTEADLDFLVAAGAPEVQDKARLRQIISSDQDLQDAFIEDEKTVRKVMADDEVVLKLSPRLYFEILLRKTRKEMEEASYTLERDGTHKVAVFDTGEVIDLLSRQSVLGYLAHMLSTFIKIEGYTISYQVGPGLWRQIRFSDLDIDNLIRFSELVDEDYKLGFFKRIADLCLFLAGVFPEYVQSAYRYPGSGELRPQFFGRGRRSLEDYEEDGRKFYQMAAELPAAHHIELSEIFHLLYGNFRAAQKPLNFMAEHYLHFHRSNLFGIKTQ